MTQCSINITQNIIMRVMSIFFMFIDLKES